MLSATSSRWSHHREKVSPVTRGWSSHYTDRTRQQLADTEWAVYATPRPNPRCPVTSPIPPSGGRRWRRDGAAPIGCSAGPSQRFDDVFHVIHRNLPRDCRAGGVPHVTWSITDTRHILESPHYNTPLDKRPHTRLWRNKRYLDRELILMSVFFFTTPRPI